MLNVKYFTFTLNDDEDFVFVLLIEIWVRAVESRWIRLEIKWMVGCLVSKPKKTFFFVIAALNNNDDKERSQVLQSGDVSIKNT